MSPRNIALLAGGGLALLALGFMTGRRTDIDGKTGQTSVTNAPPPPPTTAASASAVPTALPKTAFSGSSDEAMKDLFSRLENERKSRLNLEPTATTVFEAMKTKGGVEVEEQLQVAGWVVGAKFCDKIRTTKDVHIVVCEYADEPAAIAGQKAATNGLKRREVLRNKTTTCAVHQAGETDAAIAQAARVKDLFKAL